MKNRTIIILLSVFAVAMYTAAVINFCLGDVLDGICGVLIASSDALMAYAAYRLGQVSTITAKHLAKLLEMLSKGVPATLTVKGGKGTITLGHDEDEDEAPEEEQTEDEKRVKRMADEYDELRSRFDEMKQFRDTEEYKQMPDNKRVLYDRQCKAMDDYESALRERLRIEAKETNLNIDIKDDGTDKAE